MRSLDGFTPALIDWYSRVSRDLPWRRTQDPYAIWVSEIMLQQTRVAAVIPYYQRFIDCFPDAAALAAASEQDILSAWAGLGYYRRVRNMQLAARQVNGSFPATHEEIRELPGIGDYTAAAVASIAYGLPHAAVDGNVLRVLSRVTGDAGDIGTGVVRKRLQKVADRILDREQPGTFNQAMMELGATVCTPTKPSCLVCPVGDFCEARRTGRQQELPVKQRKEVTVRIDRTVYVIERNEAILFWQRPDDSPKLAGFWELPEPEHLVTRPSSAVRLGSFRHSITHHEYTFEVYLYRPRKDVTHPCKNLVNCGWIACNRLKNMALSTTARKAIAMHHPKG